MKIQLLHNGVALLPSGSELSLTNNGIIPRKGDNIEWLSEKYRVQRVTLKCQQHGLQFWSTVSVKVRRLKK